MSGRAASGSAQESGIVVTGFAHYGGAVADALQRFKYQDRPDLAEPLGALLRRAIPGATATAAPDLAPRRCDLVVPVPLHPRRLAERGYNQASLLGAQVRRDLDAPLVTSLLLRRVDTPAQARLGRAARIANLQAAFHVAHPERVRDRQVILVDDVATTGATLTACATALRHAGAASISALVVAIATGGRGTDG